MFKIAKPIGMAMLTFAVCLFTGTSAFGQCGNPNCTDCVQTDCDSGCCERGSRRAARCGCGLKGCLKCRAERRGPRCSCEVCELKVEEVKAKKTCYKVEEEIVCVPMFRFPWQRNCPPNQCSPTQKVKRLKKHTYECPECEYEWKVVKPAEVPPVVEGNANNRRVIPIEDPGLYETPPYVGPLPLRRNPIVSQPQQNGVNNINASPIAPSRYKMQSGGGLRKVIEAKERPVPQPAPVWTIDGNR